MRIHRLPSARLYAALAVTVGTTAISPALAAAASLAVLAVAVADALRCARLEPDDLDVTVPRRHSQGHDLELALRWTNRRSEPLHVEVEIDVPEALAVPASHARRRLTLPARSRTGLSLPLLGRRRGRHVFGAAHLRVRSPLGLSWRQLAIPIERAVEVIPGLAEGRSHRLQAWRHNMRHPGQRSARQRLDSGAFESLRDYVRGDDPRRIDWKVTARRGRPIVRRYEAERNQSILLCIDCGRAMAESAGDRQRLDRALAAALVLTEVARQWQDNVGVFVFSDRIHAVLPPGKHAPDRVPQMFAEIEARPVEPDYPRALVTISRMVSRRSLLVFFSDVVDEAVSAPLARHMGLLARRHLPLFVALRHSALHEAAHAHVATNDEARHRAAAVELVLARSKTLQAMRRAGIQVVDAPPEGSVEAAVNRYVEIKRRGAL